MKKFMLIFIIFCNILYITAVNAYEKQIILNISEPVYSVLMNRSVVYCGLVNENIFSIMVTYRQHPLEGHNLYYPKNTTEFKLKNKKFKIISIDYKQLMLEEIKD